MRHRRPPLTEAQLWQDGAPVKVRDLAAITGLSRDTICDDIRAGRLPAHQRHAGASAIYLIRREDARVYVRAMVYGQAASR